MLGYNVINVISNKIFKKITKAGKVYNPESYDHYKDQYWNNLDLVQQYINENATGNKDTLWQVDILTRFKEYVPFKKVLIIGCGNGWVERQLYDIGVGLHFDAFDILEKYLESAKSLSGNRDINYFKADINNLTNLGESTYDAIFNVGVLHHTFRLSLAVWKLSRALKPNGLMFNFDYVGPARNQYSKEHLEILKNTNSELPKRFQSPHPLRPSKRNFDFGDPSEAIHSDLVRPTIERFFDITYQRDINGGIAYQILWNNIDEFMKNEQESIQVLNFLLRKDEEHTISGKVPVLFWYGVGKPKSTDMIENWQTLPPINKSTNKSNHQP
ncbi:MAG: class I SAM-dependent methyltransferase [Nitrosopumilales archaeon]|nr:MAG: class I SAM-dependent methyltransferase [Nitrosopumilales archaeon]